MTRVSELLHRDEFPAARAKYEATTPLRTPQQVRRPYPGCSVDALAVMRAADTTPATLGMRRPVAPSGPLPGRDTIAYLATVSVAIEADYALHLDTLRVLDEISAVLTEHPELLVPPSHPGPRLWLRRLHADLAPFADAVKVGA